MSDYLSNLVMRGLAPATPQGGIEGQSYSRMDVRPRLASHFEPLSPAALWGAPGSAAGFPSQPVTFEESVVPPFKEPLRLSRPSLPSEGASPRSAPSARASFETAAQPERIAPLAAEARSSENSLPSSPTPSKTIRHSSAEARSPLRARLSSNAPSTTNAPPQPPDTGGRLTPIEAAEERIEPPGNPPHAPAPVGATDHAVGQARRASHRALLGVRPVETTVVPPWEPLGHLPSPGSLPLPARSGERSPQPQPPAARPAVRAMRRRQPPLAPTGELPGAAQRLASLLEEHVEEPARQNAPEENKLSPTRPAVQAVKPRLAAEPLPALPLLPHDLGRRSFRLQLDSELAPAPAIQIHIGRIEIRAALPAPARKEAARPSAPALLSLDEYLRQRNEEGRKP